MGQTDTDLNGAFSWRIVARRRDIPVERLARVTIPSEPTLPAPAADIPTPLSRAGTADRSFHSPPTEARDLPTQPRADPDRR
jgi:hypothetical protein